MALDDEGAIKQTAEEFDWTEWEQIKPILQELWDNTILSKKSMEEFVALAFEHLGENGRPYFKKFVEEALQAKENRKTEISALDEMFSASRRYRSSREYHDLLRFTSKFRQYAPFNCFLLHIQNPNISFVASSNEWANRFKRYPKRNARPLVILQPFGPVMFLYDLLDTEGDPVPECAIRPFKTDGKIPRYLFHNTVHNCSLHGIEVRDDLSGLFKAGIAIRLGAPSRREFADLNLPLEANYLILLNTNHTMEEKYSTLAHELAHIFCGHLGTDPRAWWDANQVNSQDIIEIEAESASFLVCMRRGLSTISERYLSLYCTPEDVQMPAFGLNAVLLAADYIEKMGEKRWKTPLKKPKHAPKTSQK